MKRGQPGLTPFLTWSGLRRRRLDYRVTTNNDIGALRVSAPGRSEYNIVRVRVYRHE